LPISESPQGERLTSNVSFQPGEEQHEASSLELTRWEADALEHFAPMVSATPRRLIRFVNVFRLIKTSLPAHLLELFVGDKGESDVYRALVAQLVIVTGAPDTSLQYFSALETFARSEPFAKVTEQLTADSAFQAGTDHETVERVLAGACEWQGRELRVEHMLATARLARRYSFTARPHGAKCRNACTLVGNSRWLFLSYDGVPGN